MSKHTSRGRGWHILVVLAALALVTAFMVLPAGAAPEYGSGEGEAGTRSAPAPRAETSPANNGFEEGGLGSWGVMESGSGAWTAYTGTGPLPVGGFSVPAPPEGDWAAVTDQTGPGSHILYQDVALPAGENSALAFYLFYDNLNITFSTPDSLDFSVFPNQQYRIDLMDPAAPVDSVAAGDVWEMLFRTEVGDAATMAPTEMVFDLSAYAGSTVRIRFAEVDNQFFFQAGVDAVRVASCSGYAPTIFGTAFADILVGTPLRDVIVGLEGNDSIEGLGGADVVCGGPGRDEILGGDGADMLSGGSHIDFIDGGAGDDELFGNKGDDFLFGDIGNDVLNGGQGRDFLDGWIGNDVLKGDGQADLLFGYDGQDTLEGGDGPDELLGEGGRDVLLGEAGDDLLDGGSGFDELDGGTGTNSCVPGNGNFTNC